MAQHSINEERVITQFSDFIQSSKFKPKYSLTIEADGIVHRYALERDKGSEKSGAYCLYLDGYTPAGWAMDWHDSTDKLTWQYEYSDEERHEYGRQQHNPETRAKSEAERKERERQKQEGKKLQEENVRQAKAQALKEYLSAREALAFTHPYLKARFTDKGIHVPDSGLYGFTRTVYDKDMRIIRYPLRVSTGTLLGSNEKSTCHKGVLIVPFIDIATGSLATIQTIPTTPNEKGTYIKYFFSGLSPKGAAFILAPNPIEQSSSLYVAEGICTALAVLVITGGLTPVFSAGSCGNLLIVCQILRQHYADKKITVMADNDEAGLKAARECISAGVADDFQYPPNDKEDFYDFLKRKVKH